jgi:hypothetical protein
VVTDGRAAVGPDGCGFTSMREPNKPLTIIIIIIKSKIATMNLKNIVFTTKLCLSNLIIFVITYNEILCNDNSQTHIQTALEQATAQMLGNDK